jgi:hypothetical protein
MKNSRQRTDTMAGSVPGLEKARGKMFAGPGTGLPCSYCHELIQPHDVEYEIVELGADGLHAQQPALRVHMHCYRLWSAAQGR